MENKKELPLIGRNHMNYSYQVCEGYIEPFVISCGSVLCPPHLKDKFHPEKFDGSGVIVIHKEGEWLGNRYVESRYEGRIKGGFPDGYGEVIWCDGSTYKGEWRKGLYHGNGSFEYNDGRFYEGQFRGGQHHGMGTFTYYNGKKYNGEFKKGEVWNSEKWLYQYGNLGTLFKGVRRYVDGVGYEIEGQDYD